MLDDAILLSTISDIRANKDYKDSPIVSTYYESLLPKDQYNEKTSYLARWLGEKFNYSPMKIDYMINTNFGILGDINQALFSPKKDITGGIVNKFITDSAYSTDVFNEFYENADLAQKNANSNPNDATAIYKNKQYASVKSIVSALNQYGKDLGLEREYKIYARDYIQDFEKNSDIDERLVAILERTGDKDVLYDKNFSTTYTVDGEEHKLSVESYLDYIEEYYRLIQEEYDKIFTFNYSDERTISMLKKAKNNVENKLKKKYKITDDDKTVKPQFFKMITTENGFELSDNVRYRYFNTSMDYLQKAISKFNFREGRECKRSVVPFMSMVKEPASSYARQGYYYTQRDRIINVIRDAKEEKRRLFDGYDAMSPSDRDNIWRRVGEIKQDCIEEVEKMSSCPGTMYLVLKDLEAPENRDVARFVFEVLFGRPDEAFYTMILESRDNVYTLQEDENGDLEFYGFRFRKVLLSETADIAQSE